MNKFMKKSHKGFTIIQLVIGMLIFAILTGIAFYGVSVYTAQANETRVDSDLGTFEVAIKDYMLNNVNKCSDGGLTLSSLNAYLTEENKVGEANDAEINGTGKEVTLDTTVAGKEVASKSTLKDPWGHEYRVVIMNNADGAKTDATGVDAAKIYVYTMGKDGKGAGQDTKNDDSVLVVQYSDGEVYSRVYQPSDKKNDSIKSNEYTAFDGKMETGIYAISVAQN